MGVVLSLRDIVDAIDSQSNESEAYLDPVPVFFATSAALSNGSGSWMHGIAIARKRSSKSRAIGWKNISSPTSDQRGSHHTIFCLLSSCALHLTVLLLFAMLSNAVVR